jgi:BirA family biotin operon repressor/biotin-[acetyl-CoA-carboxylase] ligase
MTLDVDQLRARLPGRELLWFETVASTMPEAARLAAAGCAHGALVVAEEQSAGHGRHGRSWHSEKGTGLYVSFVLRPGLDEDSLPVLTLALGLAAQEAIAAVSGLRCELRWPNDVLAGGRKCAGILCRTADSAVIAGIGINVNQESFPPHLEGIATSLRAVSGRPHSREDLLAELAESVDRHARLLASKGVDHVLRLYAGRARK